MQMTDIKILSTHAVQEVLRELGPVFERVGGFSLTIDYDPANALRRRIEDGTAFDVVVVTRPVIEALVGKGKIRFETCIDIARSGLGIVVRQGAAAPDITSVDAFKRALLAARTVAYTQEGASGMHFSGVIERLGIAEEVRAKAVRQPGGLIGELVAAGKAEIAIQQIPELMAVPGIELVGPLPAEIQLVTVSSAGILAGTKQAETARRFIEFLVTPAAAQVMKARGLEPVAQNRDS